MRVKSVRYPNSRLVHLTYGAAGAIADKLSRLDAIKDDDGGSPNNTLAAYSYNGVARMVVEDFEQPDVQLDYWGQTADTYAGFDRFGRITQQLWRDYGAPADRDKYTYAYDRNSNRTWKENVPASLKDEFYTYDNLNRLTAYSRGDLTGSPPSGVNTATDVRKEAWGLSPVGNWSDYQVDANADDDYTDASDLDQDRTHNLVNEITGITEGGGQSAWADPAFDAKGNMTYGPRPGDEATASEALVCVYDAWNRLAKVYKDNGSTSGEYDANDDLIVTYSYDGGNRRIRKVVEGNPDVTHDYYYNNGWRVLEVREDSDNDPYEQYVWGNRYVHSPVCRFRDGNTDGDYDDEGDDTLYYTTDANFNVTALINTDGTVAERYVYDPYGKVTIYNSDWSSTVTWANSKKNAVLYTGYRFDSETGLYYASYRYYHPTLGRFLQRDPSGYVDGMNLYQYVKSAPLQRVDPVGLAGLNWWEGCKCVLLCGLPK